MKNSATTAHGAGDPYTRAGLPDFDRWTEQLTHCGHCTRPVRLRGRGEHHLATGGRVVYSTETERGKSDGPVVRSVVVAGGGQGVHVRAARAARISSP